MSKFERMMAQVAAIALGGGISATAAVKYWSTQHNPYLTENEGGPRLTNQPQRGGYNDGHQVEAKPGADEQTKFRWPWDNDDDDLSGGASTGDGAYGPGGVDSEFDAEQMIAVGAVSLFIAALAIGTIWALTRNGNSNTQHASAY